MYIDTHYVLSLIIVNANSSEFSAVFIFSFLFSIFFFLSFFFFQLFMLEKMLKKDFKFSDFYSIVISCRFDSIVDLPPPIISSLFRSSVPLSFCTKKKKNNEQYYFNGAENRREKKYKCIDFERYVNFFKHVMGTNFCMLDRMLDWQYTKCENIIENITKYWKNNNMYGSTEI